VSSPDTAIGAAILTCTSRSRANGLNVSVAAIVPSVSERPDPSLARNNDHLDR
jgi:hypothetical protein